MPPGAEERENIVSQGTEGSFERTSQPSTALMNGGLVSAGNRGVGWKAGETA